MKEEPSQSSHAMSWATSSGSPLRLMSHLNSGASPPLMSFDCRCIGVSMIPLFKAVQRILSCQTSRASTHGLIQLTRMPLSPTSLAADLERPITPCWNRSALVNISRRRTRLRCCVRSVFSEANEACNAGRVHDAPLLVHVLNLGSHAVHDWSLSVAAMPVSCRTTYLHADLRQSRNASPHLADLRPDQCLCSSESHRPY